MPNTKKQLGLVTVRTLEIDVWWLVAMQWLALVIAVLMICNYE
jgi:hypothetical protein